MSEIPILSFKLLVLSFITAKRQSIDNRSAQRTTWNQSYDFIIVGAGTGGCAVASRLAEDPNINVLLLEAGPPQDAIYNDIHWLPNTIATQRPDTQWMYYGEPLPNYGRQYPNGRPEEFMERVIGGTSEHNGLTYNRGNKRDYDKWVDNYGAIGWSFREVLPYFIKSENNTDASIVRANPRYHGVGGPVQVSTWNDEPRIQQVFQRVFNSMGYANVDFNGPNQTGVMFVQQFIDTRGYRVSSATAFLESIPLPNNLDIVANAMVTRVLFNGTTAIGVEFVNGGAPNSVYAMKEVIVCAGAYNSPQLLMLSGIGIKNHLQSFGIPVVMDLPVGNNLANQPLVAIYNGIRNTSLQLSPQQINLRQLSDRYQRRTGRMGYFPQLDLYASTSQNRDKNYPNTLTGFVFSEDGTSLIIAASLVLVRSRGSIRLQSANPYISPRIDNNYLTDPRDFQDQVELTKFMFYVLETTEISQYLNLPTFNTSGCPNCPGKYRYQCTEGVECFVRFNSATASHPGGSNRMGAVRRDDVVVDPYLKVKNINNLRVCDASIFPEVPNSNLYAPVLMVAERCAQIIKDCYYLK